MSLDTYLNIVHEKVIVEFKSGTSVDGPGFNKIFLLTGVCSSCSIMGFLLFLFAFFFQSFINV